MQKDKKKIKKVLRNPFNLSLCAYRQREKQPNQTKPNKNMTTTSEKIQLTKDHFTRIASDCCGNPRYYLPIYLAHASIARKLGAVKYRGKKYGAGWVFQTYNLQSECDAINATA